MSSKKYFEKHYTKLLIEAWLKSLLAAFSCGFTAAFISAFVTWFVEFEGLWLTVGVLLGVTAIITPVFFFFKYRPTTVSNARRMDRLGLEERMVTMIELEDNDSYIAERQRQDAEEHLSRLDPKKLKITISTRILVILAITALLGIGMATVSTLSDYGFIIGGDDLLEELLPEERINYVLVVYEVEAGGSIDGEEDQLIPVGSSTEMVVAVPDDGWTFVEWDDGYKKPARVDKRIGEDRIYVAIFAPLEGDGDPSENGEESDSEGDGKPQEKPEDESEKPQEGNEESPSDEQQKEENNKPTNLGGGKYEEINQIIDGETYYKEVLEEYKQMLRERLEKEGENLSEEERSIIEAYLGIV